MAEDAAVVPQRSGPSSGRSADLLDELRRRAARRRDEGTYPIGVVRRFHRMAEELVRRAAPIARTDPEWQLLTQELHAAGERLRAIDEPTAASFVDAVDAALTHAGERIDSLEQALFRVERLVQRVERLEREDERRGFKPWFTNDAFAAHFRGPRAEVLAAYADVVSFFEGCSPVVDLGCGRGEFVELLTARRIQATGIETDPDLVAHGRAIGLAVLHGDAISHLQGCGDSELGGVAMLQVIEHLTPQEQLDIVRLCASKVRPGGRVVVESVNPQSLYVYTHALYVDPTHTRPVHPLYLEFLFRQAGFGDVQLHWRSPVPPQDAIDFQSVGKPGDPVRTALERAAFVLDAPQDFVVVATR